MDQMHILVLFSLLSSFLSVCEEKIYISSEPDLQKLRECPSSTFIFLNDVVIMEPFAPIPSFTGAIFGQNYKLTIADIVPTEGLMGVFQSFTGAIKQLYLVVMINDLHERTEKVGLFAGECNSISVIDFRVQGVINCHTKLSPTMTHYVGGFAGHVKNVGSHINVEVDISMDSVVPNLFIGGAIGLLADASASAQARNTLIRDITYSGNIIIKPLNGPQSSDMAPAAPGTIYVGGAIAKCDLPIIDFSVVNTNATILASSMNVVYGGLMAVSTKSFMSSFVQGGYVSIENFNQESCIGGAVGSLESNCIGCVNIENCRVEYKFFEVLSQTKGTAGFVGCSLYGTYTRCHGSYADIRLATPAGGFIAVGENVNISECAFTALNYTTLHQTGIGAGGFAGIIKTDSVINNSYVYVKNFTFNSPGFKNGGFVGHLLNSVIDNCFVQIENATLFLPIDIATKTGFFGGILQQTNRRTYVAHSYCKISKFNYKMIVDHNIILGGFMSETINTQDVGDRVGYSLYSSWMDVSLYLDFTMKPRGSRTCIIGIVHDAQEGLSIDNFYGRLYVESNIVNFAAAQGFCIIAHLVPVQKLRLEHVIFNFTHNYIGDPSSTPSEIQVVKDSLSCKWCDTLVIAKNKYLRAGSANLYEPAQIRSASFYSTLNWTLGDTYNWTARIEDSIPVLTGLPYILRKYELLKAISAETPDHDEPSTGIRIPDDDSDDVDPNGYTFYFPICNLDACWNYINVWDASRSVGHGELIWLTRKCYVSLCSQCKEDSPFFCETCSGGRITEQGQCKLCQEGCISCPESVDKCTKCADPSYDVRDGKCVQANACFSKPKCMVCDKNDWSLCERCVRSFWLNEEINECMPCPQNCDVCTSGNECLQCSVQDILPIAGSCDYSSTCADTQTCLYCRSDQPAFCLVCNDNSRTPNADGVCVSTDTLYCYVSRCLLCLPNNPYWCDECAPGSYVSSAYGACLHCEVDCAQCTEWECITCVNPERMPINGTCSYKEDCSAPHCKFCSKTLYGPCLQCVDGYDYDPVNYTCTAKKSTSMKTVYISISVIACLSVIGLIIAFCIIRVKKYIKQHSQVSTETKPLLTRTNSSHPQESMALSREFYTPVGALRESIQELTK